MNPIFRKISQRLRLLICIVAAYFHASSTFACIWIDGVDLHGHAKEIGGHHLGRYSAPGLRERKGDAAFWQSIVDDSTKKMTRSDAPRIRSNCAGALLHLREFEKARDILLEAERISPNDYAVAANLGTAYELLGDNENALKWIQTGISRNPDSHDGTEWVHVKILEAKIAAAKDPLWLEKHSVVGAEFGTDVIPKFLFTNGGPTEFREDPSSLIRAIGYQLQERLEFVPAPDPFVGDLLFDLANAMAVSGAVNLAVDLYAMAQEYAAPKTELVLSRLTLSQQLVKTANFRKTRNQVLVGTLVIGVIGGLLYLWIRFRRKSVATN
jgi:tetratricopeptide (TPR) repeat protein